MNHKILFIAHTLEPSGYGEAARNYALAMDSVGLDVVVRSIRPNKQLPEAEIPKRIQELENKPVNGCSICIQHLLPHLMDYDGRFEKNIGLFVVETDKWQHSGWLSYLNQMDELWVPNRFMLDSARAVTKVPVNLVPHAFDINKYNKKYDKFDIEPARGNYKFYFIGEHNRRKRISALIQAFFLEFTHNEPVSLLLKLNKVGADPQNIFNDVNKIIKDIKDSHKLYKEDKYPHVVIIPQYMNNEDINRIHATGDCFVNASFGEAWSIPAFDAIGWDKTVISSNFGGPSDFLEDYNNGYLVGGQMSPVFGMTETFQQLNSAREDWFNVDIRVLSNTMRKAYKMNYKPSFKTNSKEIVSRYSFESIGKKIKELLCI